MNNNTRSIKKMRELEYKQIGLNQLLKPALFFLLSLIFEIASFLILGFNTESGGVQFLPSYLFFDIGYWLIISALMICSNRKWVANVMFYVFVSLKALLLIANITLKGGFGYLFTFDMTYLIIEAFESIDADFINFKLIFACVFAVAAVIAMPIIFDKFFSKYKITITKVSRRIFFLICFIVTASLGMGTYSIQTAALKTSATNMEIESDEYLYTNMHIKDAAYKKFGSAGFYLKNFYDSCFKNRKLSAEEKAATIEKFEKGTTETNPEAALYDDNLIVIMMESFEWFAIDPYNTPTLWALKTGENYYADHVPAQATTLYNYVSNNKTNISEQLCMLGYMPNVSKLKIEKNSLSTKYSLPNMFKEQGYTTNFFHNWKKDFYDRDKTITNIGFDNFYSLENFNGENKSVRFNYYNLEVDFFNQFVNQIAPTDKKFFSFYTTVSSHGSYQVTNEKFNTYYTEYDKNLSLFKSWLEKEKYVYPNNKEDQEILKNYKSAAMDTDRMVELLFKHLNDTNLIENTTVVLYSDHNAYYHNLSYKIKGTNLTDYQNQTSYIVPCMIYSNKISGKDNYNFTSTYDLYPTLTSLFGLKFNTYCSQGVDIMTNKDNIGFYMSHLTGYYSAGCYSKDMSYIVSYKNSSSDISTFKKAACEFYKEQLLLETIYYAKLTY